MREIEIQPTGSTDAIEQRMEQVCLREGLTLTLKGMLVRYPGCIHWHFKNGKLPGTLELTWWAREKRLWFKISAGREGVWMDGMAEKIKTQMEQF